MSQAALHLENRLYRSDCKIVLDQLRKEGVLVDLIYLDPPFNSNRTYSMIFNYRGVSAQQKAYHDMWDYTDSTRQLVLDFRDELEMWDLSEAFKQFMRVWIRILEGGTSEDRKLLNYLMYMTQRLVRCRDILKPTGSIYFHCDPTASHYIKIIMDGVFTRNNFRSEIIWKRTSAHNSAKRYGPVHDSILFYTASDQYLWRHQFRPYDSEYIAKFYRFEDSRGKYRRSDLTGAGVRQGESGQSWGGYDPTARGRHWAVPRKHVRELPESPIQALEVLEDQGRICWPRSGRGSGGQPSFKRYLHEMPGQKLQDVWTDISPLHSQSKERRGYQTQKPLDLLRRIIRSSTERGGVVFDPFCGCGTTIEAAERLGRQWVGVDISGDAIDEIKSRLAELGLYDGDHYEVREGSPDTMAEYMRLNPFEKQDWLIRRMGGLPNPRKSGDQGVDGDMTFHMGTAKGRDKWGRVVFSVKTGKQRSPAHVRELRGTMKNENAQLGVLILDGDPTPQMEQTADKAGLFSYSSRTDLPPKEYAKVQIVTAHEIIDGAKVDCPPTMQEVKSHRKSQIQMQI